MDPLSRRDFLQTAFALGATAAVAGVAGKPSTTTWHERRDLFPEGVASAEPTSDSVLLWTRRPPAGTESPVQALRVEVAEDPQFTRVIARARTPVPARADWTARVLVGGLEPCREYWYR